MEWKPSIITVIFVFFRACLGLDSQIIKKLMEFLWSVLGELTQDDCIELFQKCIDIGNQGKPGC